MKIRVDVHHHLHLPTVFTDAGVEEILEAIAILAKDENMTHATVQDVLDKTNALVEHNAKTHAEIEALIADLDAGGEPDLGDIATKLGSILDDSKTASADAEAALAAHAAAPVDPVLADTTTGGQGDTVAGTDTQTATEEPPPAGTEPA